MRETLTGTIQACAEPMYRVAFALIAALKSFLSVESSNFFTV